MDVDVQSHLIGHLGLDAGVFDSLKIVEVIDRALPKKSSRNLPRSVVIKAMILNGLGFTGQRLYLDGYQDDEGSAEDRTLGPFKAM